MSSWGSWSKISKLQLVGDFSFFTLKIRFYMVQFYFRLSNHNVPPWSSENPYGEAGSAEFDGMDGVDGWTVPKSVLYPLEGLCGAEPERGPIAFT